MASIIIIVITILLVGLGVLLISRMRTHSSVRRLRVNPSTNKHTMAPGIFSSTKHPQANVTNIEMVTASSSSSQLKWSEQKISLSSPPRTLRAVAENDGSIILFAALTEPSRRAGQNVYAFRLREHQEPEALGNTGIAQIDLATFYDGGPGYIAFDPGPPLESAGVKAISIQNGVWNTLPVDIGRGMNSRSGFSAAGNKDALWCAWIETPNNLMVSRRYNGVWNVFSLGRQDNTGDQTTLIASDSEHAIIVSLRREEGFSSGNTVIGSYQTLDIHGGLKEDLRAAMSSSSTKDIIIATVGANGSYEESVLTTVDNAQTPGLGLDKKGRLVCAVLHADDPPDFTQFRIKLFTRIGRGWSSEDVALFEDDAPFHLSIKQDPSNRWFDGEPFIVALIARLDVSPVQIQPVLLWKEGKNWRRENFPAVDFDDEPCAHYHPVADTLISGDLLHFFVPSMRRGKEGAVRWFSVKRE